MALALELQAAGQMSEAEQATVPALDACLRTYGPDHAETIRARSVLAVALFKQRKFAAAEEQQTLVVANRVSTLGPQHPLTLASRCSRAHILHDAGNHVRARQEANAILQDSSPEMASHDRAMEGTLEAVRVSAERLIA